MGGARPVLKADATTLCQDISAKTEEPLPDIAHQPHEAKAHARPFHHGGKGDLKLLNLRHVRCAPPPLGRRPSHDRKDLKYLHAPQSRGPRHQHATDVEARPQIRAQPMRGKPHRLLYPDASALCSSSIVHQAPAPCDCRGNPHTGRTPGSPVNSGSQPEGCGDKTTGNHVFRFFEYRFRRPEADREWGSGGRMPPQGKNN